MALFRKPKYTTVSTTQNKKFNNGSDGEWFKCKSCGIYIAKNELKANLQTCPKCSFHYPMTAFERIEYITDKGSFKEIDATMSSINSLEFEGYEKQISDKKSKTKLNDAIVCGVGNINKQPIAIGVMDFRFMGASMGSVVGEKLTILIEKATKEKIPVLIITASGGARMQEGALSLMQMAKTSGAISRHCDADLSLICLLTNPTTGGVTASFASLGDVILAEPHALIGFAGARVIKATINEEVPDDFQTSEFLEDHGLVDRIIPRKKLKKELSLLLNYLV